MTVTPRVTISLVTWNGRRWLPGLFASIRAQSEPAWELVVLDNASTDGSAEWLRSQEAGDERIRVTCSTANLGYAAAHDRTILSATADAIVLLNQDVVLHDDFLHVALDALARMPEVGSVQGHIGRLAPDGARLTAIDTTGLVMRRDRRVVSRDQLRDAATVRRAAGPVWGADGPAPVYRGAALRSAALPRRGGGLEVLDEDFVDQKTDVDLAWRLRRLGWECRYEPAARAWHARSGADSAAAGPWSAARTNMANAPATRATAWTNQRLAQLKNDEPRAVLRDLPWIVRRELAMWTWMLLADRGRLRAVPTLFRLAPMALRKRRALGRAIDRRGAGARRLPTT